MTDKEKIRFTVDEDRAVIALLDELADREGTTRAHLIRRAIRQMLFLLPSDSVNRTVRFTDQQPTSNQPS